jgi:hypothetical protein
VLGCIPCSLVRCVMYAVVTDHVHLLGGCPPSNPAPGCSHLAAELSAACAALGRLEAQLAALASLGDEGERGRLERLVALVERAAVTPGEYQR